jgi:PhzF family phenazine biosynthesis protein
MAAEPGPVLSASGSPLEGGTIFRLASFTTSPDGGNPAGVWIGAVMPSDAAMQRIAADVGYSETAFAVTRDSGDLDVRYFSPLAEVSFCGHATVALGAALGTGGEATQHYALHTMNGLIGLDVAETADGLVASLTSVPPTHRDVPDGLLASVVDLLGWSSEDLDGTIPPTIAFAGAHHLVLAVRRREVLALLRYDFDALKRLMLDHGLTTLQLVWRESDTVFHVRDPFPVGGVVEDPATGAAAAALGGYLRSVGLVTPPVRLTLHQGDDLGRPSELTVDVPVGDGGISVSGSVVAMR